MSPHGVDVMAQNCATSERLSRLSFPPPNISAGAAADALRSDASLSAGARSVTRAPADRLSSLVAPGEDGREAVGEPGWILRGGLLPQQNEMAGGDDTRSTLARHRVQPFV